MADHPTEGQANKKTPPRKSDGPLTPDPLRGKNKSTRVQEQKNYIRTPQEKSD